MFHQLFKRAHLAIAVLIVSVAAVSSAAPLSAAGQRVRHQFLVWYANADGSYAQADSAIVTVTAAGETETQTASRKGWATFFVAEGVTNLSVQISPADPGYCGWSAELAVNGDDHQPTQFHEVDLDECPAPTAAHQQP